MKSLSNAVLVREDGLLEDVGSVRRLFTGDKSRIVMPFKRQKSVVSYSAAGQHAHVSGITVDVDPDSNKAALNISMNVESLLAIIDPRRSSPQAIEFLREYHKKTVLDEVRGSVFQDGFLLLPEPDIMYALTDRSKTFVFNGGYCWEITPNNQLVQTFTLPDQRVIDVAFGRHYSDVPYTCVMFSAYVSPKICSNIYGSKD